LIPKIPPEQTRMLTTLEAIDSEASKTTSKVTLRVETTLEAADCEANTTKDIALVF